MNDPGAAESRRLRYLQAMQLPVYVRRQTSADTDAVPEAMRSSAPVGNSGGDPETFSRTVAADDTVGGAHSGVSGAPVPAAAAPTAASSPVSGPGGSEQDAVWEALRQEVSQCTACALHRSRTQTVFGVGRKDADLMVIGEAPGADEDRQGEPFVGRAGKLLNQMLRGLELARDEVYIANILKCRPPNNRDPKPEESSTCTPYLNRQIDLIRPAVILAVGRISAQWLLQTDTPIGRLRGSVHAYGQSQIPVIVTYHPAYLLRSPLAKAKAWQDLLMVERILSNS